MYAFYSVAAWFWYAVIAAVLYGAHQIFTRLAADRIGEGLGGFVVEATAALSILIYLAILWFAGRWNQKFSGTGFNYSLLTGVCVGAGTIAFFLLFQKGGPLSTVPQFLLAARPSWPSLESSFFMKRPHGSDLSASLLQSLVCFCCGASALRRDYESRGVRALSGSRRLKRNCRTRRLSVSITVTEKFRMVS